MLRNILFIAELPNGTKKDQIKRAFLSDKSDKDLLERFRTFVSGVPERSICRLLISVNRRDNDKIMEELQIQLIKQKNVVATDVNRLITGIAGQPGMAESRDKQRLVNINTNTYSSQEITEMKRHIFYKGINYSDMKAYDAPESHQLVLPRGFDNREFIEQWPDVQILADGMYCLSFTQPK